jgi:predicted aspartyl protease
VKGSHATPALEITAEALIDTGFDGEVIIPRSALGVETATFPRWRWRLADGFEVEAPVFIGTAQIVGLETEVDVTGTILGEEYLAGSSLISHFHVTLDHGSRVIFEP